MPCQVFNVVGVPRSQQQSTPPLRVQWWPWGEPEPGPLPTLLPLNPRVPPCSRIPNTMISLPSSNEHIGQPQLYHDNRVTAAQQARQKSLLDTNLVLGGL